MARNDPLSQNKPLRPSWPVLAVMALVPGTVPGTVLALVPGTVPGTVLALVPGTVPGLFWHCPWPCSGPVPGPVLPLLLARPCPG